MVQNIILRNITETSEVFTYMKPYIKNDDERTDIKAFHSRNKNVAMQ